MGDWVLDSLVGFLQSPRWTHPLNNFVDETCVVFDPGEENKFSYTDIHNQYNSLVEKLLEQFMEDINMSSTQFVQAWEKCGENCSFGKSLTQQIMAAEDFLCFKAMMVQRNIELEKKAWELVEQQRRSTNFQEPPPTYSSVVYSNEETALQQTLELSKREYDLKIAAEEEELRKLIAMAEAQWVTGGQQQSVPMAPVPTDVPVMAAVPDVPVMAAVPDVPVMAAVPDVPVMAAVPDVPVMAAVPDVPVMAAVPDVPVMATVPDVPVMATVPDVPVMAAVPDVPVLAAVPDVPVMATVPDVPVMATVPDVPVLAAVPDVPVLAEPGSTTGETWSDGGHTPQIQAEAIMATVDYTSQGSDPTHPELSETEEFDFDYTSQGPDPTHPELSGAEAAAQWIQSALDESSLSPDHISLHEGSLESQATHMRQQRDHLLQTNREQRERELKAYLANPPPPPPPRAASVHKVAAAPPHSAFSWFKRGRQEDKKLGRTGILCSAIASKLKRNS